MSRGRHSRHPRKAALALAAAAVVMVFGSAAAVFLPSGGTVTSAAGLPPLIHPAYRPPPILAKAASPTPSPSTTPAPSRTYPPAIAAPRTYPAPAPRTYPPPPPRTYPPPPPPSPAPSPTYPPPPPSPPPDPGADLPPPVPLTPPLAGVATADVAHWNQMTHSRAQLVVRWVSMAHPLAPSFLHGAMRTAGDAEPVIEITPTAPGQPATSLADIAAGHKDGWLKAFRNQVAALHRPIIVSFAPEANGTWYAWSKEGPGAFIAAWRHVHRILGGPQHWITWLWQMSAHNDGDPATTSFRAFWPGGDVVDWLGLDGYDYLPSDYFERRFGPSLTEAGTIWGGPVIIAETAVSPATGHIAQSVTDLFHGVTRHGLYGLIYLNLKPNGGGFYHPDFRLDNHPAALAAYRAAVNGAW